MKGNLKLALISVAIRAAIMFAFLTSANQEDNVPLVHKLEVPLLLSGGDGSDAQQYLSPRGTSLYFDQAFPEGFIRYKIYVNVEGIKLEPKETQEKFWLDPLVATPVPPRQLKKLLNDQALTKADLRAILGSGLISMDEIRELLGEFAE